jgi:hypothetical protein
LPHLSNAETGTRVNEREFLRSPAVECRMLNAGCRTWTPAIAVIAPGIDLTQGVAFCLRVVDFWNTYCRAT